MNILVLVKNAGVEKSTAFIEVIKILEEMGAYIHIVISNQPDDYVTEQYYYNSENIIIEFLNQTYHVEGMLERIKDVIRKGEFLEKIVGDILIWFKCLCFRVKQRLMQNKDDFAYDEFLNNMMIKYEIDEEYDYIWTTDEYSLLWAEWIRQKCEKDIKIVYHCLELYWEHFCMPSQKKWRHSREYVLFEKAQKILHKTNIIIIQDEKRWEVLCQYTGLNRNAEKVLLPVSIKDYKGKKKYSLHDRLGINRKKKIIFYPTLIAKKRGCMELIQMSEGLKSSFITVIHGFCAIQGFSDKLRKHADQFKVIISNTTFGYQELIDMHQEVWCVFLYYGETDNNDKYIANSSNKLAMSLQAGKPIITIGNQMLNELCEEYKCGIGLMEWSETEFLKAIEDIDKKYDVYSENARRCYEEKYDIELYKKTLHDVLFRKAKSND